MASLRGQLFFLSSCLLVLCATVVRPNEEKLKVDVLGKPEHCEKKSRDGDTVHYHYCGRLVTGEEFDCSFNYGRPYVFTLGRGQVIQGMEDALMGVCVGELLKISIPPHLAYGERGSGSKIPPGATLVFWVKVLQIERDGLNTVSSANMMDHFVQGRQAYTNEQWASAQTYLELATKQYEKEEQAMADCRSECQRQEDGNRSTRASDEGILYFAHCLRQCQSKELGRDFEFTKQRDIMASLDNRETYSYLQHVYYKLGNIKKAATAAFTFFHFNPTDELGLSNDKYYRSLGSTDKNAPLLGLPLSHVNIMREALSTYNAEQFSKAIEKFEVVTTAYTMAMENCFGQCERNRSLPVPQTGHFAYDVALSYCNLLHCQLGCPKQLEQIGNARWGSLWAEIYNFLQYSYYKVGRLDEAAAAVATVLLLNPDSEVAKDNAAIYASQGVEQNKFSVRSEALSLLRTLNAKRELLELAEANLSDNPQGDEMDVIAPDAKTSKSFSGLNQLHPDANLFSRSLYKPVGPAKAPITKLEDSG